MYVIGRYLDSGEDFESISCTDVLVDAAKEAIQKDADTANLIINIVIMTDEEYNQVYNT